MKARKMVKVLSLIAGVGCLATVLAGVPLKVESESPIKLSIGGTVAFENGQFINGSFNQAIMDARGWLNNSYGQISLTAQVNDHLSIHLAPEVWLWFDTYPWQAWANEALNNPYTQRSTVSFAEAQGVLQMGDPSKVSFLFAAGTFPFKYNPDAKNLGEYLFRSGVHPAYLLGGFDFAYARLNGFRLNTKMLNSISLDVFLTTQTQSLPNLDWSLACVAAYSMPGDLLNVGAGVMFDRLFPVNESSQKPIAAINQYLTQDFKKEYYSFGGTKAVANLTLDPKVLLPGSFKDMLGKEDLRLYGEGSVLGFENITAWSYYTDTATGQKDTTKLVYDSAKTYYNDIEQRIPVMFGFTLPTFKIMDYLSAEMEWFGWPYSSTIYQLGFSIPVPQPAKTKDLPASFYSNDNWKFSINAKKTFYNSFSIIAQIARDHSRHDIYSPAKLGQNAGEEVLSRLNSFGWWVKLQYKF